SLPGGNRSSAPKPPLSKGGASAPPRRGDTQALPGYFLPNHSSLFTKKPSPFHIGLYFEEVPAVNPSVKNQRFLPAPFSKGAFGVQRRSPPCQRGVPRQRRGGGIPQAKPAELLTYSLFTIH